MGDLISYFPGAKSAKVGTPDFTEKINVPLGGLERKKIGSRKSDNNTAATGEVQVSLKVSKCHDN